MSAFFIQDILFITGCVICFALGWIAGSFR